MQDGQQLSRFFWTTDDFRRICAEEKWNRSVAQWFKALFLDNYRLCILFWNQDPRHWVKSEGTGSRLLIRSRVKFCLSLMTWGFFSPADFAPLYFIEFKFTAAVCRETSEHFMFPSADELCGDADLIFPALPPPAHNAKGTYFNDQSVTVYWSVNQWDLNPQRGSMEFWKEQKSSACGSLDF